MAFWGVEINRRKPYTLSCCNEGERLRLTQATLGFDGSSHQSIKEKVVVHCKVGDREPIRLCTLMPENIESCPLKLEFEEKESVVFSVTGNPSVHLSGFYTSYRHHHEVNKDSIDSYGEDIAKIENEQSSDNYSDEDDYDSNDSFINNGDPGALTPSPNPKMKTSAEFPIRLTPKFPLERKKTGNHSQRRLIKKYSIGDHSQVNEDAEE